MYFCLLNNRKKYGYKKEKIEELRAELHRHNYNYYVLNAPEISDKEFDDKMRELQDLEQAHPEYKDENSPTMRVGSDLNKNFTQVAHKYPMLSLAKYIFRSGSDGLLRPCP